ncbi:MAG: Cys-tRNA(Pro) deacylase [Oscillospiraceae bacterium]|nr:Cys-tRNA(Pro) deacylase [Oscillospiraceae bacterium]
MTKTNALRLLDAAGIPYNTRAYDYDEKNPCGIRPDGMDDALQERMFKTLTTRGERLGILIFVIPVNRELDLKKCAQAAGDKRVEMVHMKELLPLTGYMRGGCSPVGMKKKYPVIFDEEALLYDAIFVSAGQRGLQMEVEPQALIDFVAGRCADVTKDA